MAFDLTNTGLLSLPKWLLVIMALWVLAWKGFSLWKSARRGERVWFVALLIINTMGILEILYLFLFSKIDLNKKSIDNKSKSRKRK